MSSDSSRCLFLPCSMHVVLSANFVVAALNVTKEARPDNLDQDLMLLASRLAWGAA